MIPIICHYHGDVGVDDDDNSVIPIICHYHGDGMLVLVPLL